MYLERRVSRCVVNSLWHESAFLALKAVMFKLGEECLYDYHKIILIKNET